MKKINPIIKWWVTPMLPYHDVFELPLLKDKSIFGKIVHLSSQWLIHPFKRRLARWYLRILQKFTDIKVIAVTGSSGKSTTVQMVASILKLSAKTLATPPSIDPVYNVPNTILKTQYGTKFLILEFSVEYPGEMDFYLWLAKPDIGVITNISATHTEYLGNIKGVAMEKGKLLVSLSKNGIAILNKDNKYLVDMASKTKAKVVWFGKDEKFRYNIKKNKNPLSNVFTLVMDKSNINVHIPILGEQFVENAVAAATCANISGVLPKQIKEGLESFMPLEHRMNVLKHQSGALILDDSYNNNPLAAKEALKTFISFAGDRQKIVVMGDMLELGEYEDKFHKELGKEISLTGTDFLIGVGNASKVMVDQAKIKMGKDKVVWYPSVNGVEKSVKPFMKKDYVILIKGSRSIGLDKLVSLLECV